MQAVERAFEVYRSALLKQDGKAATEGVSSSTIAMYQEYRDLAVSGDEPTLRNLSMGMRMQVLLLRHRIAPKSLKAMDGKAVFAHAVDQNWIGNDAVVRAGLKDIAITGPRATAKVTIGSEPTADTFHFVKEGERWTLDLTPAIRSVDQMLQQAARSERMSENEFLFSVIGSLSGRKVTDTIWRPLDSRRRRIQVACVDDVAVVTFVDRKILDAVGIQELGDELFGLVEQDGYTAIVLDFQTVEFLSSAALNKVILFYWKVKSRGGKLRLCHLKPEIREVFVITRLNQLLDITDTLDDALAAFRAG